MSVATGDATDSMWIELNESNECVYIENTKNTL